MATISDSILKDIRDYLGASTDVEAHKFSYAIDMTAKFSTPENLKFNVKVVDPFKESTLAVFKDFRGAMAYCSYNPELNYKIIAERVD